MAKKNITFRIDENLIAKLNELRGNKSQNAFLEELLTSTSTSTSNEQANIDSQVQVQLLAQTKAIEELQVQVQLLVNERSQVQVQSQVIAKPKIKQKPKQEFMPVDNDEEEHVPFIESIVDIPDFQKRELTPQDFYGKIPEKEEYVPDPDDDIDRMMLEAGMS